MSPIKTCVFSYVALVTLGLLTGGTSASKATPIRISIDYSYLREDVVDWQREVHKQMKEELMPKVMATFGRLLRVKDPIEGPLFLPDDCEGAYMPKQTCTDPRTIEFPGICFPLWNLVHRPQYLSMKACEGRDVIPDDACTGAPDTDLLVYVMMEQKFCGDQLASSGACHRNPSGRPIFGMSNLCIDELAETSSSSSSHAYTSGQNFLDLVHHEFTHILAFAFINSLYFEKSPGVKYSTDELYQTDALGITTLVAPKLEKVARDFYNCHDPNVVVGYPLVGKVGGKPRPSHADYILAGSLMTPCIDDEGFVQRFGAMTMAYMEDSGWYEGNWDKAEHVATGYQAGCDYLTMKCKHFQQKHPFPRHYAAPPIKHKKKAQCAPDHLFGAYAESHVDDELPEGCSVFSSKTIPGLDCTDATRNQDTSLRSYGADSRCIETVTKVKHRGAHTTNPTCMKMKCTKKGKLQLVLGKNKVDCPSGKSVDLSQVRGWKGVVGPCPDNKQMCDSLSCPNGCSGDAQGTCFEGTCRCHVGWAGEDCSKEICIPSKCKGTCNFATGMCEKNLYTIQV